MYNCILHYILGTAERGGRPIKTYSWTLYHSEHQSIYFTCAYRCPSCSLPGTIVLIILLVVDSPQSLDFRVIFKQNTVALLPETVHPPSIDHITQEKTVFAEMRASIREEHIPFLFWCVFMCSYGGVCIEVCFQLGRNRPWIRNETASLCSRTASKWECPLTVYSLWAHVSYCEWMYSPYSDLDISSSLCAHVNIFNRNE